MQDVQWWSRQARSLPSASVHKCNFFIININCFRVDTGKRDPCAGTYFRWPSSRSPPASPYTQDKEPATLTEASFLVLSPPEFPAQMMNAGWEWPWGSWMLVVWAEYFCVGWNVHTCAFKAFCSGGWKMKVSGLLSRSHPPCTTLFQQRTPKVWELNFSLAFLIVMKLDLSR